jgi:tRNA (mo5U34)-methyltransferase
VSAPEAALPRVQDASWYHVLELPGGVVTDGEYDLRPALERVPFPQRLDGQRCLDVGTRDGFWAFEMDRRGAAEVVGIDVLDTAQHDWPQPAPRLSGEVRAELARRNQCFEVAKQALGSRAERRIVSVYDLDPAELGEFDFAVLGTLLLHLRDPIGALTAVRRVTRGRLLLNEVFSPTLTALRPRSPAASLMSLPEPFWWIPNLQALRRYVVAAGWEIEAMGRPYLLPNGPRLRRGALAHLRRRDVGLGNRVRQLAGSPHVWIVARPRP